MEAAKRFFTQALAVVGHAPERVTSDGPDVFHRTNTYLNNRLEQDHRGIKQRYYPMRGDGALRIRSTFLPIF